MCRLRSWQRREIDPNPLLTRNAHIALGDQVEHVGGLAPRLREEVGAVSSIKPDLGGNAAEPINSPRGVSGCPRQLRVVVADESNSAIITNGRLESVAFVVLLIIVAHVMPATRGDKVQRSISYIATSCVDHQIVAIRSSLRSHHKGERIGV